MKRGILIGIFVILFVSIFSVQIISSSVSMGPQCFVVAEVGDNYTEIGYDQDGGKVENRRLGLKVLKIVNISDVGGNEFCPVEIGLIYSVSDSYPITFNKKDKIMAGVEKGSSMGTNGAVGWLHWGPIVNEDGTSIINKDNLADMFFLSGSPEPVILEDNLYNQKDNVIYFYVSGLVLVILIIYFIYRFKFKK